MKDIEDGYTTVQTQALQDNADRLGLIWKKRPATIVAPLSDDPTGVTAIMDGDTVAINVYSLIGIPAVGARVMCDIVPPSGVYITGYLGATPGTILGGKVYVTAGNKTIGVTTTETLVNDYTVTINEPAKRFIILEATYKATTTVANDTYIFRIRRDSLVGTEIREDVRTIPTSLFGYQYGMRQVVQGSGSAQTYVMTAQRIGGSGSLSVAVQAGQYNFFVAYDMGNYASITEV